MNCNSSILVCKKYIFGTVPSNYQRKFKEEEQEDIYSSEVSVVKLE